MSLKGKKITFLEIAWNQSDELRQSGQVWVGAWGVSVAIFSTSTLVGSKLPDMLLSSGINDDNSNSNDKCFHNDITHISVNNSRNNILIMIILITRETSKQSKRIWDIVWQQNDTGGLGGRVIYHPHSPKSLPQSHTHSLPFYIDTLVIIGLCIRDEYKNVVVTWFVCMNVMCVCMFVSMICRMGDYANLKPSREREK